MTYAELLENTANTKVKVLKELEKSVNGEFGFLFDDGLKIDSESISWVLLARGFCDTLEENVREFIEQAVDTFKVKEIFNIYMTYKKDDFVPDELLPVEAQLFTV